MNHITRRLSLAAMTLSMFNAWTAMAYWPLNPP